MLLQSTPNSFDRPRRVQLGDHTPLVGQAIEETGNRCEVHHRGDRRHQPPHHHQLPARFQLTHRHTDGDTSDNRWQCFVVTDQCPLPNLHASARRRARSRRPSQRKAKPHGRTQPADRRGASRFGKRTPVIPIPPLLAKRTNSIFVPSGTWAGTRERRHKAGSRSSRATLAAALTLQCWRPRSARWRSSHVTKPSPRPYLRPHAPLSPRLAVSRALSAAVSPA